MLLAGDGGCICLISLFTACSELHEQQRVRGECPVVLVLFFFFFSLHFCSQELLSGGLPSLDFLNCCISVSCYTFPKLRMRHCWKEGRGREGGSCKGDVRGSVAGLNQVQFSLTCGSGETGPMMLFSNKPACCAQKGKPGLRALKRQAEE